MSDDEIVTITRGQLNAILEELRILREENRILREENRILREKNRILRERLDMRYAKRLQEHQEFMSRNCASAVMFHGR